jgi:hypothetical protein
MTIAETIATHADAQDSAEDLQPHLDRAGGADRRR